MPGGAERLRYLGREEPNPFGTGLAWLWEEHPCPAAAADEQSAVGRAGRSVGGRAKAPSGGMR